MRAISFLLLAALAMVSVAFADPPGGDVETLIRQLGSAKFKEREAANLLLDRLGADALPALQAAQASRDAEVRQRATHLVQKIELRLLIGQLLAAKKIRLAYREVGVLDALNDFSARAGVTMEVDGDRRALRDRTLSLETPEMPFWEALDLFCQKAGLRERSTSASDRIAIAYGAPNGNGVLIAPVDPSTAKQRLPRLALEDATRPQLPTAYFGALRFRAVPPAVPRGQSGIAKSPRPEHVGFILEVNSEPTVPFQGIVSLRIGKAVDDRGQTLQPAAFESAASSGDPLAGEFLFDGVTGKGLPPVPDGRQAVARLQPGKEPAVMLKEFQGTVTMNLIAMRKLLLIDKVLAAAGKDFKASDGTVLTIVETSVQESSVVLRVQLATSLASVQAGNGVRLFKRNNGSVVIDGIGEEAVFLLHAGTAKPLAPSKTEITLQLNGNGGVDVQYALRFSRPSGQSAPIHLSYSAPRLMTVDIPFALRDVPLVDNPQLPVTVIHLTK